ncbi:MAG TPA: hypothetical protein VFO76_12635 [Candidatus Kapabacteria bacterium]|nr:hypothetical protein [Candidatus Kapabacteria bacterium]
MKTIVLVILSILLLPELLGAQQLSLNWEADPQLKAMYVKQQRSLEVHPVLPMVFFKKNTATIERHVFFTSPNQAAEFKPDTIGSILTAQRNYLNYLGYGLQKNPSDTVTLIAYSGGDNGALTLANARSEKVRAYLVDIWGIVPERITIKTAVMPAAGSDETTEEGREENRRVEIVSSQQEMMPIVVHTITGIPEPMTTTFSVEASNTFFASREIQIWYEGKSWAVLPLGKNDSTVSWNWRSDPGNTIPLPEGVLKAEVVGIMESGEIRRSRTKAMEVKLNAAATDSTTERTYHLICYPDEQRSFGQVNAASIDTYIAPAISQKSTVSIITHTEGLSAKEKQRVQALAKSISGRIKLDAKWKKKNLKIVASNDRLFSATSPEERMLAEMIEVKIADAPASK